MSCNDCNCEYNSIESTLDKHEWKLDELREEVDGMIFGSRANDYLMVRKSDFNKLLTIVENLINSSRSVDKETISLLKELKGE